MPPWHADPATGEFDNDRRLTRRGERDAIAQWVAAGAPEGDPGDLPAPPRYADGWTIGQPDAVLTMQEDYPIPASGTVAYQYFEVPTNFTEDKWIQAFEVRPGNRTVVHHVIVYSRPPAPAHRRPRRRDRRTPARRPAPLFTFARRHGDPGGPDRRSRAAARSAEAARTERPAGAEDARAVVGAYVPGTASRVYPAGHGGAPGRGLDAGLPDALHDDRKAHDGSHEHRPDLREGRARRPSCAARR